MLKKENFRLQSQRFWGKLLDNHYRTLALLAVFSGLVLGFMFLFVNQSGYSVSDQVVLTENIEKIEQQDIQKPPRFTYYKELHKRPKTLPSERFAFAEKPKSIAVKTEKPSKAKLAKAVAHVLGGATPKSVQAVVSKPESETTTSAYVIQLAAINTKEQAEALVKEMLAQGIINVRTYAVELADREFIYKVQLQGFETRGEAQKYKINNKLQGVVLVQ